MHTCNEIYQLETPVTEEQCKELMKSTGFGYPGGPDRAANLELPVTSVGISGVLCDILHASHLSCLR